MALLLEQTVNGVMCTYHRVAEVVVDPATAEAYAVVHSHTNEAARLSAPVWRRTYRFARVSENALADAYARIKTLPEWAGAEEIPG